MPILVVQTFSDIDHSTQMIIYALKIRNKSILMYLMKDMVNSNVTYQIYQFVYTY